MTPETYAQLLRTARQSVRDRGSAEDTLHEALLLAARTSIDVASAEGRRWVGGAVRNITRQKARSDRRRRAREAASGSDAASHISPSNSTSPATDSLFEAMAPSARRVVVLALHGLGKAEICDLLGLSGAAFRQRLVVARRALGPLSDETQREALALAYARTSRRGDDLALGLVRRALLRRLGRFPGAQDTDDGRRVGTHDPDGHLLIVRQGAT